MATNHLQATSGTITWSTAANWSGLAAPATGDNTTVANSSGTISEGLAQQAVTLASLSVPMTFTGTAGTAAQTVKSVSGITRVSNTATATSTAHGYSNGDTVDVSGADQADYDITAVISNVTANTFDYTVANTPVTPATGTMFVQKSEELHLSATVFRFGEPGGGTSASTGCARWKQNFGAAQLTAIVTNTAGSTSDAGREPLRIRGTHASNKLYVNGGRVGVATNKPGQASTFSEISITGSSAVVNVGSGVTLTTFRQTNGTATLNCAMTDLKQDGGTVTTQGSGAITNVTVGGTAYLNATGTIGTLTVNTGGVADLTKNQQARTVTTIKLTKGATLKYDPEVITVTNAIQLLNCTPEDVTLEVPENVSVVLAAL